MKRMRVAVWIVAVAAMAPLFTGCASVGVNPMERDVLAKPQMQFEYRANDLALDDHIYFSKEASSGGRGFGGGGCGCN